MSDEPVAHVRLWRTIARVGLPRTLGTLAFLVIALAIARYSWQIPLARDAERAMYDVRFVATAPSVRQDDRIVMVVFNDDTLIATRKRSPLDRDLLARALAAIDGMGAKAIGIDILFDQPQDEDPALVAALRAMKTTTWIAYADVSTNANEIGYQQQRFLDSLIANLDGSNARPASIRLETDDDNVVRSWPRPQPTLPPLLANAMAPDNPQFARYDRSIAFRRGITDPVTRVAEPVFAELPIDLFADPAIQANPDAIAAFASQIRGRYVLIGGDIIDFDRFDTPFTRLPDSLTGLREQMIGLEVHAQILAQKLDGRWLRTIPDWALWLTAMLVVVAGALSSMMDTRLWRIGLVLIAQLIFFLGLPFVLQARGIDTQGLPAFGWGLAWLVAFASVGTAARSVGSEQRKFAQSALGKYLPRDIAADIIRNPDMLALHGEKREIFVVFTDLEGFTKLSHGLPAETVARVLNAYLDRLSDIVLDHGGTIDKFVGDAIVAFWGAPIARADDGERAARAAVALHQAGEDFRHSLGSDLPPVGQTRVGLHCGEAVVGNFGGEGRIQYTALGDGMNTASRLESANKQLGTGVIVSSIAAERSGLDWFRPMGRVTLRGRATPVDILEPRPDLAARDLDHLRDAYRLLATDRAAAIATLAAYAAAHPDDAPIANLVYRLNHLDEGGSFVLA